MAHSTAPVPASDKSYTRGVADFIAGFGYEDLPEEVRQRLKLLILDSLGCGIYGLRFEWSQILVDTLRKLDSSGPCLIWGSDERISAPHAALINGTLVQSFELDDIHARGLLHIGCSALPPIFALAETGIVMTGKDLLRAAACGYEVGPRVGLCMGQQHLVQGWHASATIGVFAAVAAASAALRLTSSQAAHALGIAATQASGLMAAQFGSMVKRMHAGRAAQSGLYAASLAKAGFTGIKDVFETPYGGFCTTFSASKDNFDLEQLTSELGVRFETMDDAIKLYSCAASNHSALDAIASIRARRPFAPEEITRIVVHGSEAMMKHVYWKYVPDSVTTAQFNMPFVLATFIVEHDAFVDQFNEAAISDPRRLALTDRVEFVLDPEATAGGAKMRHKARVEMHFANGEVQQETVTAQRGSPSRFPSEAEMVDKFMKLSTHVVAKEKAERICAAVLSLEQLEDASDLASLLSVDEATRSSGSKPSVIEEPK